MQSKFKRYHSCEGQNWQDQFLLQLDSKNHQRDYDNVVNTVTNLFQFLKISHTPFSVFPRPFVASLKVRLAYANLKISEKLLPQFKKSKKLLSQVMATLEQISEQICLPEKDYNLFMYVLMKSMIREAQFLHVQHKPYVHLIVHILKGSIPLPKGTRWCLIKIRAKQLLLIHFIQICNHEKAESLLFDILEQLQKKVQILLDRNSRRIKKKRIAKTAVLIKNMISVLLTYCGKFIQDMSEGNLRATLKLLGFLTTKFLSSSQITHFISYVNQLVSILGNSYLQDVQLGKLSLIVLKLNKIKEMSVPSISEFYRREMSKSYSVLFPDPLQFEIKQSAYEQHARDQSILTTYVQEEKRIDKRKKVSLFQSNPLYNVSNQKIKLKFKKKNYMGICSQKVQLPALKLTKYNQSPPPLKPTCKLKGVKLLRHIILKHKQVFPLHFYRLMLSNQRSLDFKLRKLKQPQQVEYRQKAKSLLLLHKKLCDQSFQRNRIKLYGPPKSEKKLVLSNFLKGLSKSISPRMTFLQIVNMARHKNDS